MTMIINICAPIIALLFVLFGSLFCMNLVAKPKNKANMFTVVRDICKFLNKHAAKLFR